MLILTLLVSPVIPVANGRAEDIAVESESIRVPVLMHGVASVCEVEPGNDGSMTVFLIQGLRVRTHEGSGNVVLVRLLDIHAGERKKNKSFKHFIDNFVPRAFMNNLWGFPVKNAEEIIDPKTPQSIPKILVPKDIKRQDISYDLRIRTETLPEPVVDEEGVLRVTSKDVEQNSLIWQPQPYVLAGSFHREMYPHDTSAVLWAILDLANKDKLNDKREYLRVARHQLENFSYQVNNFGFPLNGNRGYYLTRSQTNVIPTNVLQYYLETKDMQWLETVGLPTAKKIFDYWTAKPAKISTPNGDGYRYIAHGDGPCLEVMESHKEHNYYYFKVLQTLGKFLNLPDQKRPAYAQDFDYKRVIGIIPASKASSYITSGKLVEQNIPELNSEVKAYLLDKSASEFDQEEPVLKIGSSYYKLTKFYYRNDRASRVSGYDTNHLYGPFNSFTYDFIPVDHNVLLYKQAKDVAEMERICGNALEAAKYTKKAEQLKQMIMKTLWDRKSGMFFEYDSFKDLLRIEYPFLSSAYALWAEIFDSTNDNEKLQLLQMVRYLESNLEGPAGFYASSIETGLHWDKPYVWPVQQQYVVSGLREYADKLRRKEEDKTIANYLEDVADRIAIKYLLANYGDWLASNGSAIGEKVILKTEDLHTGYEVGSNYSWNLTCAMYFYETLSQRAKKSFDSLID